MRAVQESISGSAPDSRLSVWLSYCVLLTGFGAAVASAYIVISTYSPLPHWDEWALFAHLANGKSWSLAWLWAQHNEHRILIPKIFFLLDVQFFRGTQVFLLASIFAIQLMQVALLSFSLWSLGGLRGSAWRTGTGLIAFCILCPTQYENLVWGFQLQFVIPAAMATLSTLTLLFYYRESRLWLLALSIAAATIATWSLANGMLLWPLLLLEALWMLSHDSSDRAGLRACVSPRSEKEILQLSSTSSTAEGDKSGTPECRREGPMQRYLVSVSALLIFGAVNIGLYLYGYHRPSPQSGVLAIRSFGEIPKFVAVYFGSTFVRHSSGGIAIFAGSIGLCIALCIITRELLQDGTRSLLLAELSLLMLLCIVTAAITASGRLHLGLEQATASRYQTFALLFWCSVALSLLFYVSRNPLWIMALSGILLALMLGFATQLRLPLMDAQWRQQRLETISLVLFTGVHDPAVLADAYPDPQVVLRAAQYMKNNHLSIFASHRYSQVGQLLDAFYKVKAEKECSGYVSSSQILPSDDGNGLRLTGYGWDREQNRPAREIVTAVDGRIEGFGTSVSIPLNSATAGFTSDAARFGWLAFVRKVSPATKIDLYAVIGKQSGYVCHFADALP